MAQFGAPFGPTVACNRKLAAFVRAGSLVARLVATESGVLCLQADSCVAAPKALFVIASRVVASSLIGGRNDCGRMVEGTAVARFGGLLCANVQWDGIAVEMGTRSVVAAVATETPV